jgi:dihydroxyacetone kinase-like predicted kinase
MEKQSKKSRRAKVFYTLKDKNLNDVQIDLNNYRVICNKTGKSKSFYHKYLFDLIVRKYNSNIDLFREGYVSREAAPSSNERRKNQLVARIQKLSVQLSNLKGELAEVESGVVCFPDA